MTALHTIMTRDVICAERDLEITRVISLMVAKHIGCLPVVDERRHPVGVITKLDLVEQLDTAMRAEPPTSTIAARTAEAVMMPLAMTLGEHATISMAAALMDQEDTHHVLVVNRANELVGIVSSKDIVRWVASLGTPPDRREPTPPEWHPFDS